jgi:hypothetical protein
MFVSAELPLPMELLHRNKRQAVRVNRGRCCLPDSQPLLRGHDGRAVVRQPA